MGSPRWRAVGRRPSTSTWIGSRGASDEDWRNRVRERDQRAPREASAPRARGAPDRVPCDRRREAVRLLLPRRGHPERGERGRETARGIRERGRRPPSGGGRRGGGGPRFSPGGKPPGRIPFWKGGRAPGGRRRQPRRTLRSAAT